MEMQGSRVRSRRRPSRINVKALVILLLVMGTIGGGAIAAHFARKQSTAKAALAAGKAALAREDWPTAAKQLKKYLSKYPDNVEMLQAYGDARMAIRPTKAGDLAAAVGAYRRILRHRPADARVSKQLTQLYLRIGDPSEAAHVCQLSDNDYFCLLLDESRLRVGDSMHPTTTGLQRKVRRRARYTIDLCGCGLRAAGRHHLEQVA